MPASEPFPDRALGGDGRARDDTAVDPEMLRAAIDRHAAYIYRIALSIVRDRALADDVVQETMIRAWRGAPIQPDGDMPRAWLARVAATPPSASCAGVEKSCTDRMRSPRRRAACHPRARSKVGPRSISCGARWAHWMKAIVR